MTLSDARRCSATAVGLALLASVGASGTARVAKEVRLGPLLGQEVLQHQPADRETHAARDLRLDVPAGASRVQVQLSSADLFISGAAVSEVRVEVERPVGARASDLVSLTRTADGGVQLLAGPRPAAHGTTRLRLVVPVRTSLDRVALDAGRLSIVGVDGGVSAHVVRGAIEVLQVGGHARLEVDTGDITALGVRLAAGRSLKCRTFNGHVRVELDEAPANARILALTLNGALASPLPLTTRAAFGPRFAEATFGAGEHVLSIDVVRGDISIGVRPDSGR